MPELTDAQREALDAAAFRRLLTHLDAHKDVANIDLMLLAGFCRNCLGDWWQAAAAERGLDVPKSEARARVYGMDPTEWKARYQAETEPDKLERFRQMQAAKAEN